MQPWSMPSVPYLPGTGFPVRLYDTAGGAVRPVAPGATARLYVCGITPYDAAHLGHAFTYLTFDLLQRVWLDAGHQVHYVQNVTDIDDPLLERATRDGVDWQELAAQQVAVFAHDMELLRILPPREYVGAVESMGLVIEYIEMLSAQGATYRVDQDLYFSVGSDADFGAVSGWDRDQMLHVFPTRGGDPERVGKRDPLDCLVWLGERPGEPSWDSPFGKGRPGWHIECTAIAISNLGMGFDVQGGGSDLVFPHHEMCASEAHVAAGERPFARHYAHVGMVGLDGEKMSKSKGNLEFVDRLVAAGHDPAAVRLALLSQHWRTDWEWRKELAVQAEARLERWRAAVRAPAGPPAGPLRDSLRERLSDDLDAPGALAAVDRWAEQARLHNGSAGADDTSAPAEVAAAVDALLGVAL